ncbi:MAG: acyloxyacyl hydrolase [Bacteroidales bacterium]|nr:acyloxyacyl hydrolase [Bacteroidales bacterium]MBN2819610.1 acyloxyacyl hydrolase [Bacteroidales bacterium]
MIKRIIVLIFLPLLVVTSVIAQNFPDSLLNGVRLNTKINYGFVYPHNSSIEYLLNGNVKSFEISLSTWSNDRHIWEELYRRPNYGMAYNYLNFSNPEILGHAHAVFGYFAAPFHRGNQINVQYHLNLGYGYISKTYEPYSNPLNLAVSSHGNIYVGLDLYLEYCFKNGQQIRWGLETSHYSNGKFRSPNLGLNILSTTLTHSFELLPEKNYKTTPKEAVNSKHIIDLIWNVGWKRDDMLNDKLYQVSTIIGDYWYYASKKYLAGGGIDFFYDETLRPTKEFEDETKSIPSDNYQMGLHAGAMAKFGNLSSVLNVGYYVIAGYHKYATFYSRLGLRYSINSKLNVNFTVKAHYAIADYLEWGIGYRFNLKQK